MQKYLARAAEAYYDGVPFLSDAEFDYLARIHNFNQLGAKPLREGTVPHFNRLYSLQKYYIGDDIKHFKDEVVSQKLDGSCISLTYVEDQLISVATRGDGFIGEDITPNFIGWEGVPQELIDGDNKEIIQVVGELVAPKTIKNARNYAAGASRLKDRNEFLNRDIQFIAYGVFAGDAVFGCTYTSSMKWLENFGFTTILAEGLEDVFPTDGLVYRINSNKEYLALGFTAKHPKGAYAVKDASDQIVMESELLDVVWQVAKDKITPVAIFEEIIIGDKRVNKASLYNPGYIERAKLCIGDKLQVTLGGQIIPKIIAVIKDDGEILKYE